MEALKTKKSIKHFTKKERAILLPYVTGLKKITIKDCKEIGSRIGRDSFNVYQYVYRQKKALLKQTNTEPNSIKVSNDKTTTRDKSVNINTPVLKQGEFIIPVSSWEVRTKNGNTSLVLKFDKSI